MREGPHSFVAEHIRHMLGAVKANQCHLQTKLTTDEDSAIALLLLHPFGKWDYKKDKVLVSYWLVQHILKDAIAKLPLRPQNNKTRSLIYLFCDKETC